MRSAQMNPFSMVPSASIPRSMFNRSHCLKTTFDAGRLIPVFVDEVLPGDTFTLNMTVFARLATPIVPIMDNAYLDFHFFFVPNRLLWSNWQKFCGEQLNPGDSISYLIPQVTVGTQELFDYLGIYSPYGNEAVSALFPRAYNLIYNEWYRDENLCTRAPQNTGDGPDAATDYVVRNRGKRHDYFTSCLPWPQKGTAVSLPLGTSAPVSGTIAPSSAHAVPTFWDTTSAATLGALKSAVTTGGVTTTNVPPATHTMGWDTVNLSLTSAIADLSNATAATINALRQAFQVQKLLERDARGGTRYTEIVKSHFGVTSPDARLQRPEYLGGSSIPVIVNPVAQSSATGVTGTPQGNLAAFGHAGGRAGGFTKSFTEHGVLIGLVSARADMTYSQGVPRMWKRRTRYDFYWPAFATIGEQAVLNREIYCQGDANGSDAQVFGYQEAWAEYRYFPGMLTNLMRVDYPSNVSIWHLAQNFGGLPTLGQTFIEEPQGANSPFDRVIAVPSQPHFLMDSYFDCRCARPMPVYSVPGLIDHF